MAQRLAMGRNQAGSTLQSQALLGCVGGFIVLFLLVTRMGL